MTIQTAENITTRKLKNGLLKLGFDSGWAVSGGEIVLWQNSNPQPKMEVILEAAKDYVEEEPTVADKLASVGLSVDDLRSALGI